MKLTKTANTKIKPGMTLIEITVVILVLLTLISVLFIGANIYKKGADRAACILNIRNVHQAVRANQNLTGKNAGPTGHDLERGDIIGTGKYLEAEPACPTSTIFTAPVAAQPNANPPVAAAPAVYDYNLEDKYPSVGTVAAVCAQYNSTNGNVDASYNHQPDDVAGW